MPWKTRDRKTKPSSCPSFPPFISHSMSSYHRVRFIQESDIGFHQLTLFMRFLWTFAQIFLYYTCHLSVIYGKTLNIEGIIRKQFWFSVQFKYTFWIIFCFSKVSINISAWVTQLSIAYVKESFRGNAWPIRSSVLYFNYFSTPVNDVPPVHLYIILICEDLEKVEIISFFTFSEAEFLKMLPVSPT